MIYVLLAGGILLTSVGIAMLAVTNTKRILWCATLLAGLAMLWMYFR